MARKTCCLSTTTRIHPSPTMLARPSRGVFAEQLRTSRLTGVTIWMIKQVPLQTFDPKSHLMRAVAGGRSAPVGTSLKWNRERHKASNEIIDELQSWNVTALDPESYCYDAGGNSIIFDGTRTLYYDDDHLSSHGADYLLRPLMTRVFSTSEPNTQ